MNSQLTLLELNTRIRNALQDAFPETVWVVAEISEMKENRTGHCYMELVEKDDSSDEIRARARATIWSYSWRMIRPYFESTTGQRMAQGIKVLVQASVEFHPSYGLSLNIKDIDPAYTIGDLVRRRREIIRQLTEAGVMNMNKELELPLVPQRIAVISSATAAGYQDFVNHLEQNEKGFYFDHRLFEAVMQGSETVRSILAVLDQIYTMEEQFDAVVIIRGGGATADLGSFDNFDLAYAVAQFPLPVITGIGHEKDDTIVDLVAHTRMKTPTAVAEFFITGAMRFYNQLLEKERSLVQLVNLKLDREQEKISSWADDFSDAVEKYLMISRSQLQKSVQRLQHGVTHFTYSKREALQNLRFSMAKKSNRFWQLEKSLLGQLVYRARHSSLMQLERSKMTLRGMGLSFPKTVRARLSGLLNRLPELEDKHRLLDPANILRRGFTLTSQDGRIMKSAGDVSGDRDLETRFFDGTVKSKIIKK
jgi:exodeoxyribonuclease VII large subunit